MSKYPVLTLILLVISLFLGGFSTVALANHLSGSNFIPVLATNVTGTDLISRQVPAVLSSQTLIDGLYMDSDGLDTSVHEATNHPGYMPGTGRVQMLACFSNAAVNQTSACNNDTAGDITLPATASEVYEFAADSQFRHLWLNVSTPAIATWTITWEYYNGSSYVALSNVTDGTNAFQDSGLQQVLWDFPGAGLWPESTLHAVSGYWVRARVSAFTSITTVPLGRQAWYETGRWWMWEQAIAANEEKRYDIHLDTPATTPVTGTFTIAATGNTGYVLGVDPVYPPAFDTGANPASFSGVNTVLGKSFGGVNYEINELLVRFDTGLIPDNASVTAASLSCTLARSGDADSRNVNWEWYQWETVSGSKYTTTAQGTAHSSAVSSIPTSATRVTFDLTAGLEQVNKAGFTGLRGHISGVAPTGVNSVVIAWTNPCSLDVTYTEDKIYHYYFPRTTGYTLVDSASLEPGSAFEFQVAGYLGFNGSATSTFLVSKGGDLSMNAGTLGGGTLRVIANGAEVMTASGIDSGYHTVTLTQGGVGAADQMLLLVDGAQVDSAAPVTINNNATAWTFASQANGAVALDYVYYETTQSRRFLHQIRTLPNHELEDLTGNGNDAIAKYPDTLADFSVTVSPAQPVIPAAEVEAEPGPEVLGDTPAIDDFSDAASSSSGGFFVFDIMSDVATSSGMPFQYMTATFAIVITLVFMVVGLRIFGSALPGAFVAVVVLVVFWQMGAIPGWMPWVFGIAPVPFFLIWKRASA